MPSPQWRTESLQDEPRGTGDALRAALAALPDDLEEVLVLSGDVPLVAAGAAGSAPRGPRGSTTLRSPWSPWTRSIPPAWAASSATTAGPSSGSWRTRTRSEEELQIGEINAGLYAFDAAWLRRRIGDLRPSPVDRRAVPDRPRRARPRGRPDRGRPRRRGRWAPDRHQRPGPARAGRVGPAGGAQRPLDAGGVTMLDPSTVYLDHAVELAQDVVLEPNVTLRGPTRVGERTQDRDRIADRGLGDRRGLRDLGQRRRAVARSRTG